MRARLRIQSLAVTGLLITGLSACAPASFSTTPTLPPVAGERLALKDIEFLADPLKYEGPSTALLSRAEIVAPALSANGISPKPRTYLPAEFWRTVSAFSKVWSNLRAVLLWTPIFSATWDNDLGEAEIR